MPNRHTVLCARLERDIVELEDLRRIRRRELTSTQSVSFKRDINEDVQRLAGKIEGIRLAISYIQELDE